MLVREKIGDKGRHAMNKPVRLPSKAVEYVPPAEFRPKPKRLKPVADFALGGCLAAVTTRFRQPER